MGLTIKPIACPGGCLGCYEKEIRESGTAPKFEIAKVLKTLAAQMELDKECKWNSPTLHGGEPLLLPMNEIEAILKMIFDKYGRTGIQTSGIGMRPDHVSLFIKYKTCVGISIDGDTAFTNAGRWNAPGFDAAEMTQKTLDSLSYLKAATVTTSAIVILRQCNAGHTILRDDLIRFALRLRDEFGVLSMRFNPVIAFDGRTEKLEQLNNKSLFAVYRRLILRVVADETLKWYPALDFIKLLNGGSGECIFTECDPWATDAEIPILGDGSLSVCMKCEGLILRTEKSNARYEALRQVRQEVGGCKGCYWWPFCKGGCPGAGINGDWRNRSRFCEAYKKTFGFVSELAVFNKQINDCKQSNEHGDKAHGDSNDPAWRKIHTEWKGK